MLPVAEEYKKILLVEPAVADSITGDKWNRYIFRTGRNSSQDAISNAVALDKPTASRSRRWRRTTPSAATASRRSRTRSRRPRSSTRNTCRTDTTDFTAGAQRLFDALKDKPGRKVIVDHLGRRRATRSRSPTWTRSATASRSRPAATSCRRWSPTSSCPGMEGAIYYYFGIPKNPVNDWLVAEPLQAVQGAAGLLHRRRHGGGDRASSRR